MVRMISEALATRRLKAAAVSIGSLVAGSLTVSKKRSMLNEATVSSSAVGVGTGTEPGCAPTVGGVAASGSIVYVRKAKSSGPVMLVMTVPAATSSAVVPG